MANVVKHGWTHRPRNQGGTDPIEFTVVAAGTLQIAVARQTYTTLSYSGDTIITFSNAWTSDPATFGTAEVDGGGKFRYLTTSEEGFYRLEARVFWEGSFAVDLSILATTESASNVEGTIGNAYGSDELICLYETITAIDQLQDHPTYTLYDMLKATYYFNYDRAVYGGNPLKVGTSLRVASGSGTKDIGAGLVLERLGDIVESMYP